MKKPECKFRFFCAYWDKKLTIFNNYPTPPLITVISKENKYKNILLSYYLEGYLNIIPLYKF